MVMYEFKDVSIIGRMAFGIIILDQLLPLKTPELNTLIDTLWKFTEGAEDETALERKLSELDPFSILDDHPKNNLGNYNFYDEDFLLRLKEQYLIIPRDIHTAISAVIETGCSYLYGSITENGAYTFEYLDDLIEIAKSYDVDIPSLKAFKRSSFKENHGWGDPRSRSFWIN